MSGISFSSLNSLYSFLFFSIFKHGVFYRKTFMFSFYDFDVLIHYFHQHLDFAGFGHCIGYLKIHPMTVHCKSKYLYAEIKMSIIKFNLNGLYHRKCASSLTLFVLVFSPVDNGAVGFVVAVVAVVRPIQYDTGQYANLAANVTTHPSDNLPIR